MNIFNKSVVKYLSPNKTFGRMSAMNGDRTAWQVMNQEDEGKDKDDDGNKRKLAELSIELDRCKKENNFLKMRILGQQPTASSKKARGTNKQTKWNCNTDNLTNHTQLKMAVAKQLWQGKIKFLTLEGDFTRYDEDDTHDFVLWAMKQVYIPETYEGAEPQYYEDFVLPVINQQMSALRAGFVNNCKKKFKG